MTDHTDPIYQKVSDAKLSLYFMRPFYGHIAYRLEIVDASQWCKTAATDGRRFFYNREFIKELTEDELIFLMAHEVLHCALLHIGLRGSRDKKIWNVSNDYIINYILVNERCGSMPRTGMFDVRFTDEMSSDEVYEFIVKNQTSMKLSTMDEHLDAMDEDDDETDVSVSVSGQNGPPRMSKDEVDKMRTEIKAAMIEASIVAKQRGSAIPGSIAKILDSLTNPIMDWRSLLDTFIRSQAEDEYTFSQPSRRGFALSQAWGQEITLPGNDDMLTIEIDVGLDVSASMSEDMLRDLLSEVKGIAQTFADFKIRLWSFDTQVHNFREYGEENVDEIDTYPLMRGGGTLFEANWDFMKEKGMVPERFVCFTDGEPNRTWGDPHYCDTLFIVHSDPGRRKRGPFGLTAWYEPKKKK